MNHLDLFSGILGFAKAAHTVWAEDYHLIACCEIDPFCQKIIKARTQDGSLGEQNRDVPIISDIRDVTHERLVSLSTGNGLHTPELRELQADNGETQAGQNNDAEISRHRTLGEVEDERIMAYAERNRAKRNQPENREGRNVEQDGKDGGKAELAESRIDLLTGGFP